MVSCEEHPGPPVSHTTSGSLPRAAPAAARRGGPDVVGEGYEGIGARNKDRSGESNIGCGTLPQCDLAARRARRCVAHMAFKHRWVKGGGRVAFPGVGAALEHPEEIGLGEADVQVAAVLLHVRVAEGRVLEPDPRPPPRPQEGPF